MAGSLAPIDFAALSPLLIMLVGILVTLLAESFLTSTAKTTSSIAALVTLLASIVAALVAPISDNPLLTAWIRFDPLARTFMLLFLCVGVAAVLLAISYFRKSLGSFVQITAGEYFFLLLASILGLILISSSADFLTLFIGLETLSISLYILCGYLKRWQLSHEAAAKYFFMGSLATAFLLYGIALIYGAVGHTHLASLHASFLAIDSDNGRFLFYFGIAFVTAGLAFKAAIFPFHSWAPDVYEGSSTPLVAFMAVGTKIGAFAAFVQIFLGTLPQMYAPWNDAIALLAIPSLILANFVAFRQSEVRRFFAYSGISHAAYLLFPFAAGTADAISAVLFYLIVYALATFAAFAALANIDSREGLFSLSDLKGLFYRAPLCASILSISLLTLAGIPPSAGFFAKFYILKLAFEAGYSSLVVIGLLCTILSAFYYLRLVALMAQNPAHSTEKFYYSREATCVGIVACTALIALSIYPTPLLQALMP